MVTKKQIEDTFRRLQEYENSVSNSNIDSKLKFCRSVLKEFYEHYESWIKGCPYSNEMASGNISPRYIEPNGVSDILYLSCARFLREYILYLERLGHRETWVGGDWYDFKKDAKDIVHPDNKAHVEYITNGGFDVSVINHFLGDKSYQAFLNYEDNVTEAERKAKEVSTKIDQQIKSLKDLLDAKEHRVNQLAGILNEQKIAFNFVGLSQGFSSLLNKKKNSKNIVLSLLFFIGVFLFIPLFTYIELQQFRNDSKQDLFEWLKFIPFIGVELIILYLFRVVLSHYNSIKAEIIQLELRQTLCQFIQSYAEYAKEIKEKDSSSLEKFENLIFSSILSSSDKIPSTFDGLEQIINIIKEIKKPTGSA